MSLLGKYIPPSTPAELQLRDRLRKHVDIFAGLIGPRHLGKPDSLHAATAYIEKQFTEMALAPQRETYTVNTVEVANIVAQITGHSSPDEIVIVGAHYDTVPQTPGADDNASAVAMLIEVARLLAPTPHRRSLRFVAFPCEEPPHFYTDSMGSQQYARACRKRGDNILGMICLEMVGYYTTAPNSQTVPPQIPGALRFAFPTTGDFLAAVANLKSLKLLWNFRRGFKRAGRFPLYAIALPESVPEIHLSDNGSFWSQNYPALMITDTSFLRNPHYHRETDTPETLDYDRLTVATLGVAGGVARLSLAMRAVVVNDA